MSNIFSLEFRDEGDTDDFNGRNREFTSRNHNNYRNDVRHSGNGYRRNCENFRSNGRKRGTFGCGQRCGVQEVKSPITTNPLGLGMKVLRLV